MQLFVIAEEISREIETAESGESVPLRDTHVFVSLFRSNLMLFFK